jgi:uncharacterized linocin/CFP29 family protein
MMADLNWSDAQWQKVNDAVNEAFGKASVATAFLPCYGPLAGSTETVRNEHLIANAQGAGRPTITLDADHSDVNLKLVNLTANVQLSSEQVADDTLSNALLAFRRAANILAQEQDEIVFAGINAKTQSKYIANNVTSAQGLADASTTFEKIKTPASAAATAAGVDALGAGVVSAVVDAISKLEDGSNPGPFACVLGNELFEAVQQPSFAFVLPSDRITPLLRGPLLRSGKMDEDKGIVVSLAGNAIDIVVGTPPTVQFLQRTSDAKFLFRVYVRFALRIRDAVNRPVRGFKK